MFRRSVIGRGEEGECQSAIPGTPVVRIGWASTVNADRQFPLIWRVFPAGAFLLDANRSDGLVIAIKAAAGGGGGGGRCERVA